MSCLGRKVTARSSYGSALPAAFMQTLDLFEDDSKKSRSSLQSDWAAIKVFSSLGRFPQDRQNPVKNHR